METGDWRGMQPPANGGNAAQKKTRVLTEVPENASFADVVGILKNAKVAGAGFEPLAQSQGKMTIGEQGAAKSGAVEAWLNDCPVDLSDETRAVILVTIAADLQP